METSRPYRAIPSPKATKISALPNALGSLRGCADGGGGGSGNGNTAADTGDTGRQGGRDQAHSIGGAAAAAAVVEASAALATMGTAKQNRSLLKRIPIGPPRPFWFWFLFSPSELPAQRTALRSIQAVRTDNP